MTLLDYNDNDIYLHIDKKVKNFDFERFGKICKKSKVHFIKNRVNVKWGHSSQIKTEMRLFERAAKEKKYEYYHIISGVDMPLKSQKYMHRFFDGRSDNFIFYHNEPTKWDYQRVSRYHILYDGNSKFIKKLISYFNNIQDVLKIDRIRKYNFEFKRGFNWCSVTNDFVKELLKNKKFINKLAFASVCADECYKQIILLNSKFKNTVYINPKTQKADNLRLTEWINKGNSPRVLLSQDYEKLINSEAFFARKFDENVDMDAVNMIYDYVQLQG